MSPVGSNRVSLNILRLASCFTYKTVTNSSFLSSYLSAHMYYVLEHIHEKHMALSLNMFPALERWANKQLETVIVIIFVVIFKEL